MLQINLENLGTVNKNLVTLSNTKTGYNLRLHFSYETIVSVNNTVIENLWSVTTGKLLNQLEPDKSKRVTEEQLNSKLAEALKELLK